MYTSIRVPGEVQSTLSNLTATGRSKSRETSLAIAYAIARRLALPQSEMLSHAADEFFNTTLKSDVNLKLDQINEAILIDRATTMDLVRALFKYRVHAAYPAASIFLGNPETAVFDFLGVSKAIDMGMTGDIQRNCAFLSQYVSVFNRLLDFWAGSEA